MRARSSVGASARSASGTSPRTQIDAAEMLRELGVRGRCALAQRTGLGTSKQLSAVERPAVEARERWSVCIGGTRSLALHGLPPFGSKGQPLSPSRDETSPRGLVSSDATPNVKRPHGRPRPRVRVLDDPVAQRERLLNLSAHLGTRVSATNFSGYRAVTTVACSAESTGCSGVKHICAVRPTTITAIPTARTLPSARGAV